MLLFSVSQAAWNSAYERPCDFTKADVRARLHTALFVYKVLFLPRRGVRLLHLLIATVIRIVHHQREAVRRRRRAERVLA